MFDVPYGSNNLILHLIRHQRAYDFPEQLVILDEEERNEYDAEKSHSETAQGGSYGTDHSPYRTQ